MSKVKVGGGGFAETEPELSQEEREQIEILNDLKRTWQKGSLKIVTDNLTKLRLVTENQFMTLISDGAEESIIRYGFDIRGDTEVFGELNVVEAFKLLTGLERIGVDEVQKCFSGLGLELNSVALVKEFLSNYFPEKTNTERSSNVNQRLVIVWILVYLFFDYLKNAHPKASVSSTSSSSSDRQGSGVIEEEMRQFMRTMLKAQEAAALESQRAIARLEHQYSELEKRIVTSSASNPPSSTPRRR